MPLPIVPPSDAESKRPKTEADANVSSESLPALPQPEATPTLPSLPEPLSEEELNDLPSAVPTVVKKRQVREPEVITYEDDDTLDDETGEYRVDPRTGVRYRTLPKTELDSEGAPKLHIEDFNADNLNAEADSFLAHLRVTSPKDDKREAQRKRDERLSR